MTDLKQLMQEGNRPPESAAGKAGVLLGSAMLGKESLQSAALGMAANHVSPEAGDHMSAFARSGNIGAGVAGAVVGAIKPPSEHDESSLAVAASLASNPAAAVAGYAAVQLGGDYMGDKGIATMKLLAAGAGLAAGAPVLAGAYGLYEGGRELYEAFSSDKTDKPEEGNGPQMHNSFQPSRSLVVEQPQTPVPEEPTYAPAMDQLGWGPGGPGR